MIATLRSVFPVAGFRRIVVLHGSIQQECSIVVVCGSFGASIMIVTTHPQECAHALENLENLPSKFYVVLISSAAPDPDGAKVVGHVLLAGYVVWIQ